MNWSLIKFLLYVILGYVESRCDFVVVVFNRTNVFEVITETVTRGVEKHGYFNNLNLTLSVYVFLPTLFLRLVNFSHRVPRLGDGF